MDRVHFAGEVEVTMRRTSSAAAAMTDWREEHATLVGQRVALRELRVSDAASLFELLTAPEVARFVTSPPATVEGFARFIAQTNGDRGPVNTLCFAVTLVDNDAAIGMFQIREIEPRFHTAEWGFALGSAFWGTGVFTEAAQLMMQFAFEHLRVHRLEARVAVRNGRGTRALQKIGAVPEGVLRKAFFKDGQYLDQVMYAIVADDWRASRKPTKRSELMLVH
jgi:ribosomal-protein-alanine N-acetyltransferase